MGYVEDEESPEMIMKKFEELERLQKEQEELKKKAAEEKENIAVEKDLDAKMGDSTRMDTDGLDEEQLEAGTCRINKGLRMQVLRLVDLSRVQCSSKHRLSA